MDCSKQDMRRELRQTLAQLEREQVVEKSQKLSRSLNGLMQRWRDLLWGVFSPLSHEPRWQLAIQGLPDFALAYPRLRASGEMEFARCTPEQLQRSQEFGVEMLCPPSHSAQALPQALLVPALGFTSSGERMGRGKGYYDRFLKKFEGLKIGICFHQQLRRHLPTAAHDQKVQMVVTDEQIVNCLQQGKDKWIQSL